MKSMHRMVNIASEEETKEVRKAREAKAWLPFLKVCPFFQEHFSKISKVIYLLSGPFFNICI